MTRLGAVFVALCMIVIAGSLGAVLHLSFGFTRLEAAVVSIAALTGLALFNALTARARARADVDDRIGDLSRGTADLARQVGELGRRLIIAEAEIATAAQRARETTAPLSAEIADLGGLLKRLADSVAAHESAIIAMTGTLTLPVAPVHAPSHVPSGAGAESAKTIDRAELGEPETRADPVGTGRFKGMEHANIVELIRSAVEDGRVDLYLQPIVTLPQRKVRYYEGVTRLRTREGELLLPADFLGLAQSAGLMPMIDGQLLFRCVQVIRRLLAKNREIGLFCNICSETLVDSVHFPQFSEFMAANRALASSLVLEFPQATVRSMGPIERESLAGLAELGFRFSMDHITDLRLEPRDLTERSFRFVKVPAPLLLNRTAPIGADIHPADFSDLLGRFGIDLIAERIESEGTVVDLLDFDVRFGQGFLFSPPRPVRAEVLQGMPATPLVTARADPNAGVVASASPPSREPPGSTARPRGTPPERRTSVLAQLARGVRGA